MDNKLICTTCKKAVDSLNEADQCESCYDAWFESERAYYYPLYLGEKLAGLVKDKEDV